MDVGLAIHSHPCRCHVMTMLGELSTHIYFSQLAAPAPTLTQFHLTIRNKTAFIDDCLLTALPLFLENLETWKVSWNSNLVREMSGKMQKTHGEVWEFL